MKNTKFAPELLEEKIKNDDLAGGDKVKLNPLNPTAEDARSIARKDVVSASMIPEVKDKVHSRFAPKTYDVILPSSGKTVKIHRIALKEETIFRSLATSVVQMAPLVQQMNMRGISAMYQQVSEAISKTVISCTDIENPEKLPLLDKTTLFYKIIEITYGAKHSLPYDIDQQEIGHVNVDLSKLKIVIPENPEKLRPIVKLSKSFDDETCYAVVVPPTIEDEPIFYTEDIFSQIFACVESITLDGVELTQEERIEAIEMLHPTDIEAIEEAVKGFGKYGIDTLTKVKIGNKNIDYNVTIEALITYIVNGAEKKK